MVWVVETGMPAMVARPKVMPPPRAALEPLTGVSLVILEPMVLTMRQPPR